MSSPERASLLVFWIKFLICLIKFDDNIRVKEQRVEFILTKAFFIPSISVGFFIDFGSAMGESFDNDFP